MKQTWRLLLLGSILLLGIARADVLDNWTTNQVNTNSARLTHIAYGNGCYVAVGQRGDEGDIYSSADGVNWTLRYTDQNSWGLTLTYSGGRFVGVGGWEYATSSDGTNWAVSFLPSGYLDHGTDMTFGNGIYVEVGDTNGVGNIITSTDAVNWTPRTSSPAIGGHIQSVTYGASKFVAVGNNDGLEYTAPATGVNAGKNWTRSSIPGGSKISFGNGLFIVPIASNSNLLSTDGINWSMKNTGLTNQLGKVVYSSGLFLARVGNYLATSSDGTNWFQYAQKLAGNVTGDATVATDGNKLLTMGFTVINAGDFRYNSFVYASDALVSVRQTNSQPPKVVLSGLVGRNYQIQATENLKSASSNWRTNITLQLTNTPFVWTDPAPTNTARFYRGVLLP